MGNTVFSQLINLEQKDSMTEHIKDFQRFNMKVNDFQEEHRIDVFIGSLKDSIQDEVHLWELVVATTTSSKFSLHSNFGTYFFIISSVAMVFKCCSMSSYMFQVFLSVFKCCHVY